MPDKYSIVIVERLVQLMGFSFFYIYAIAKIIGSENKEKWFKRRSRSTFFTRRGFMGEYINFGYPICWQGCIVFLVLYGLIFAIGYWYLFVFPVS